MSVATVLCLALACTDRLPTATPGVPDALLFQQQAAVTTLGGCARFRIELSGRDRVSVSPADTAGCGPIRPAVDSATFDRTAGQVRLFVRLENAGTQAVRAPAGVYGWEDSLVVTAPAGLAPNGHTDRYLAFISPDSAIGADAQANPGAVLWRFDGRLTGINASELPPGIRSEAREVVLAVHQGVQTLALVLRGQGRLARAPVPAIPPDSIPAGLYAESSVVRSADGSSPEFLRDVLLVMFTSEATTEDRTSALDLVSGDVIGGIRLTSTDGSYLVRVPAGGQYDALERAASALRSLRHVRFAGPEFLAARPNYLTPTDGSGWDRWKVTPSEADGGNWGLEAIAAPLAWGCATGDSSTHLGVVDEGFRPPLDLSLNVRRVLPVQNDTMARHGTLVASILGARGDNTTGVTGMVWTSSLHLYGTTPGTDVNPLLSHSGVNAMRQLMQSARDGAEIINLSLGVYFRDKYHRAPRDTSTSDSSEARRAGEQLTIALQMLEAERLRPLIIVGAGNDGVDAWWSGFPQVRDAFPVQVLVVGALTQGGGLLAESNRGPLVDVLAPGERVGGLDLSGGVLTASGTSVSTPLVTGIAGQLASFDPRLPVDSLKALIVEGALRGQRVAGGVPIANAYESLRAAAERRGAPLCGNRVWADGGHLIAQRDRQMDIRDTLFDVGGTAGYVNVHHGGHRVDVYVDGVGNRTWQLQDGWWRESTSPAHPLELDGGAYWSQLQVSHDQDSAVLTRDRGTVFEISIRDLATRNTTTLTTVPANRTSSGGAFCLFRWTADLDCVYLTGVGSSSTPYARVAYSPRGDYVVVSVSDALSAGSAAGPFRCPFLAGDEGPWCGRITTTSASGSTTLYSVRIRDGAVTSLGTLPGTGVYWLSIAEDGAEVAVGRGATTMTTVTEVKYTEFRGPFVQYTGSPAVHAGCGITYIALATGTVTGSVDASDVCMASPGGGTFAPIIAAR
jgi:hypothetical protein